jgi:hypothetical protein
MDFLQKYLSYLKEYPNSFKLVDDIIILLVGGAIGWVFKLFFDKFCARRAGGGININIEGGINTTHEYNFYLNSSKLDNNLDNAIQKPITMKEPDKKPNTSTYFDGQNFLQDLTDEECNRFKDWFINNKNLRNEIDEWYKALNFFIGKATINEFTLKSNEYLSYLIIKYFGIYQKEKKHTPLLNELNLIKLDTSLGKEVFNVAADYMDNLRNELEKKYNGVIEQNNYNYDWSRGWKFAVDEGLKKIDEAIREDKIKSRVGFIQSCTDFKERIPEHERVDGLIEKIIIDSVAYYKYNDPKTFSRWRWGNNK